MKSFAIFISLLLTTSVGMACEVNEIGNLSPEIKEKLVKQGSIIRTVPCDSLKSALKGYLNKRVSGGRRLEPDEILEESDLDSMQAVCRDPRWKRRLNESNSIQDADARVLITASILDEAEEYKARDYLLNNRNYKPCAR